MKPAIFAAVLTVCALPALAEETSVRTLVCKPLKEWRAGLETRYGETPVIAAMAQSRPVLILANPETGTWTMLAVYPDRACMVGAGGRFQVIAQGDPA